jgi:hypothetical protein
MRCKSSPGAIAFSFQNKIGLCQLWRKTPWNTWRRLYSLLFKSCGRITPQLAGHRTRRLVFIRSCCVLAVTFFFFEVRHVVCGRKRRSVYEEEVYTKASHW